MSNNIINNPPISACPDTKYTYVVLLNNTIFEKWMYTLYNDKISGHVVVNKDKVKYTTDDPKYFKFEALIKTGEYTVEGIRFFYKIIGKQGHNIIWTTCAKDFYELFMKMNSKWNTTFPAHKPIQEPGKVSIYNMDQYGRWNQYSKSLDLSKYNLIGYKSYCEKIVETVKIHEMHTELLKSIGEAKSLNIAFYGPPGVGKTTLCNNIASILNMPIYMAKADCITSSEKVTSALNPGNSVILIFEDFDRFLDEHVKKTENGVMSMILNCLDGFEDQKNVVRIFTANNPSAITKYPALLNRMNQVYKFDYPTEDFLREKFNWLVSKLNLDPPDDEVIVDTFIKKVAAIRPQVTLRPFTSYCIRYMLSTEDTGSYMNRVVENIAELNPMN